MRRSRLKEEDRAPVRKKKRSAKKKKGSAQRIPVGLLARFTLDEGLTQRFCDLVEQGLPPDGACDYLGILPSTFWGWVNRGQAFLSALSTMAPAERSKIGSTPTPELVCAQFVANLRRALADYRLFLTKRLHQDEEFSAKDWVRWITILERRDRTTYSRQEQTGGGPEEYSADEKFL